MYNTEMETERNDFLNQNYKVNEQRQQIKIAFKYTLLQIVA